MAKAKTAKKAKPAEKKASADKLSLLKSSKGVVATAAKLVKAASKIASKDKKAPAPEPAKPEGKKGAEKKLDKKAEKAAAAAARAGPPKPKPRATKLPPVGEPLTTREMEQLLTAGQGRGVVGEGSLKGKLVLKDDFPYLYVVGRDKRELQFLLQGPDQETLPAYADHKVSVSGLIRKTTNYAGTVDVRKYTAKKPEVEAAVPAVVEEKLKFLSPGEIEQLVNAGMGAGMKGFATIRGGLEMTGDDFFLVLSAGGTRQQVSFILEGKAAKGLRKYLGQVVQATGVAEKSSGWGGKMQLESFEPRTSEYKAISRDHMELVTVEGLDDATEIETRMNQGVSISLPERAGHIWAIEPTVAKRLGLRESNFQPAANGPGMREFFFTPRNPGVVEVDFFLAKAFSPTQVAKTHRVTVTVKPV